MDSRVNVNSCVFNFQIKFKHPFQKFLDLLLWSYISLLASEENLDIHLVCGRREEESWDAKSKLSITA